MFKQLSCLIVLLPGCLGGLGGDCPAFVIIDWQDDGLFGALPGDGCEHASNAFMRSELGCDLAAIRWTVNNPQVLLFQTHIRESLQNISVEIDSEHYVANSTLLPLIDEFVSNLTSGQGAYRWERAYTPEWDYDRDCPGCPDPSLPHGGSIKVLGVRSLPDLFEKQGAGSTTSNREDGTTTVSFPNGWSFIWSTRAKVDLTTIDGQQVKIQVDFHGNADALVTMPGKGGPTESTAVEAVNKRVEEFGQSLPENAQVRSVCPL